MPKSSSAVATPSELQAVQRLDGDRAGLQHVLGQLELEAFGRQVVTPQQALDRAEKIAGDELLRGDVERDARVLPAGARATGAPRPRRARAPSR